MLSELRAQLAEPAITTTFASIGLVGYLLHYAIKTKGFDVQVSLKALAVGLAYVSFIGGLRVWLLAFDKDVCKQIDIEAQYFFIAGVITIIGTASEVLKLHREIPSLSPPSPTP